MGLKIRAFTHFQGVQLSMVAGANLMTFLAQAPLDPNQHHDGIMYSAALASAECATPNLGAFAQYGPLSLGAVSLIFVLIFQLILDLATSREDLKSPALKGMRGTGMVTMQLDSTLLSLSTFGKAKQIAFQCEDGLYAGASAKYMAADQRFVNWGPGGISSLPKTTQIFVCHKPNSKLRDAVPAEYREVFNIGDGYGTRNALFER